ncbi:porin family protein [Vibrio parahaemolyticus]|uniref:outer membrane beta-barrel protein n=1 Tax=Vibrio parahaemolyticus TaxID=670 RepID=UPI001655D2E2|nr:outer membrane beta-barrel protein [Vibrio parahaemolyticus]EHR0571732.1 porin family protein [Vibrio parahaemolyticus]EIV1706761.1 porin family protein [Vibrio parahaemolyticus]ELB2056621.1 porin family protein [Vibrio parahaemolyticus]ELI5434337.1 porin family protein [Vibrio parahaemolyticus]EME0110785.1 porin family protein [Vibrio parahaemolyticus]
MIKKQHCLGILSALGLSLSSFSASADFYAGALLSYSNAELKSSSSESVKEGSPFLLSAQAGYFFNDYIGLEGRYGTSVQRDSGLAVDSVLSGFVKLNMPVSERVALYGLAGYSSVQLDLQNVGSHKEQGFSFGLGMHYALNNKSAVIFEFVDNVSEDQVRLNSITLGFQHRF